MCRKQTTKNLDAHPVEKNVFFLFSGLGEGLRTPRATSRPLDHGSTDIFEAVMYTHWPCPTRSESAAGWFYVEIKGLSSNKLRVDNFQRQNKLRRVKKKTIPVFPTATVR